MHFGTTTEEEVQASLHTKKLYYDWLDDLINVHEFEGFVHLILTGYHVDIGWLRGS